MSVRNTIEDGCRGVGTIEDGGVEQPARGGVGDVEDDGFVLICGTFGESDNFTGDSVGVVVAGVLGS
ncbi:hypothetical protein ACFFGR_08310 [Arthrobacter liuii]|uniref:Uncharacterized protein n=1 Tax=Arthrobacter liuii TaxID=1476996 RepID=A0ABQ2AYE9_9MICC|nr:hypothetical protein [Arthrobacter liuii]GGI01774.1 hypothetical protein GCM10007170_41990 [Arthrobacter liuii]